MKSTLRLLRALCVSVVRIAVTLITTIQIGDANSYLGELVLVWAKHSPSDPRIPEALYIGAQANQPYKYDCGGWEQDEEVRTKLEKLLREKYPNSAWTAKLNEVQPQ
jgi:hypothetical protein